MYVCWSAYFTRVVLPPFADMIEDEEAQPIFFPLPFTFQVVESRPYKGTDPEWQAYIRIARDRELLMKIRNDMLDTVRAAAEANPILRHRCGKEMTVRKHWLDLDFPYRPPPKITRDGLLLNSEGLGYVTAEVDAVTMMRISRALWPEPVALSATSFVTTLCRQNMQNVARFFGFGEDEKSSRPAVRPIGAPPPPEELAKLSAMLKRAVEDTKEGQKGDTSATGLYPAPQQPRPQPEARPARPDKTKTTPGEWQDLSGLMNAKDLIPFESVRTSIDAAWRAFRQKLSETWHPLRPQPPGGSVGVSGLVELQSKTSRVMIEVTAFWDPKTRKYDAPTMHMKLRSIRPRQQMPL